MIYKSNENKSNTRYYHLHKEFIVPRDNINEHYDCIEGRIRHILLRKHCRNGEEFTAWHLVMEDGGESYDIMFPANSKVPRNIVMSLASDKELTGRDRIRIEVFVPQFSRNTVANVFKNGKQLRWYTVDMPPVFYNRETGNPDYSGREAWLMDLVPVINARLAERSYGARGEED